MANRGIQIDMDLVGLRKALAEFESMGGESLRAAQAAVYLEGEKIQADAVRITPKSKDGGWLQKSKYVDDPPQNEASVRVGFQAEYAAPVHEMPSTNNFTTPGTGPKFLEIAWLRARKKITRSIGRYVFQRTGAKRKSWK